MQVSTEKKGFLATENKNGKIKKNWMDNGLPLLIVLPFAALFFIFFYYPALSGFWYSLTNWNGMNLTYKFIGIQNYIQALGDDRFWNCIGFTFKYAIVVTLFLNVFGLVIALLLNQEIRFRKMFRGIYFFPAVLSTLTIGYIFNNLFYYFVPSIGKLLHITALQSSILGDSKSAIWGVAFVNIWQGVAMTIIVFLAGFQSVPESIYESAKVEGAGAWKRLTKITLPLIIPSIMINLILTIKGSLSVYDYLIALTNGGPGNSTESIVMFIVNKGYNSFRLGYSSAASMILFVIFAVISITQITLLRKREVQL